MKAKIFFFPPNRRKNFEVGQNFTAAIIIPARNALDKMSSWFLGKCLKMDTLSWGAQNNVSWPQVPESGFLWCGDFLHASARLKTSHLMDTLVRMVWKMHIFKQMPLLIIVQLSKTSDGDVEMMMWGRDGWIAPGCGTCSVDSPPVKLPAAEQPDLLLTKNSPHVWTIYNLKSGQIQFTTWTIDNLQSSQAASRLATRSGFQNLATCYRLLWDHPLLNTHPLFYSVSELWKQLDLGSQDQLNFGSMWVQVSVSRDCGWSRLLIKASEVSQC